MHISKLVTIIIIIIIIIIGTTTTEEEVGQLLIFVRVEHNEPSVTVSHGSTYVHLHH